MIPVILVLRVAEFWVTYLKSAERWVQNCFCKPRAVDSEKVLGPPVPDFNKQKWVQWRASWDAHDWNILPIRWSWRNLACQTWGIQGFKQDLRASFQTTLSTAHKQVLHKSAWWKHEAAINWNEHFRLNIMRGKTSRTVKQWNKLPRKAVWSPYLVFMTWLNKSMNNLIWSCSCLSMRLDKRSPTVPFNLNYLKILWWQVHMSKLIVF